MVLQFYKKMDREKDKMSNRFISFLIFLSIILIVVLFGLKPSKQSNFEKQIEGKNIHITKLTKEVDSLRRSLKLSYITRNNYQEENKRLIKDKQQAIEKEKIAKRNLSLIQEKYDNISNDSAKNLLTKIREEERPDLSNEKWALEKNDSVKAQSFLLQAQESEIKEQDTLIWNNARIISTFQDDSVSYNQILANKDTIIQEKSEVIEIKDKEIKPLKKKITLLAIIAGIFGLIALAK